VVPGKCHRKEKRQCEEGVGVFKVQNYLMACQLQTEGRKIFCTCELTANGAPLPIQVTTCSGDPGKCP
jgi:hypothetical protein